MFDAVTLEYLGAPSRSGGRRAITKSVALEVFSWDENIKQKISQRYWDLGVDAQVIIFLADPSEVTAINAEDVQILKDGIYYDIVENIPVQSNLGLESTYEMLVKRRKEL